MQAVLDGKTLITYQTINANAEDMMSIPTSVTAKVISMVKEDITEFAIAA